MLRGFVFNVLRNIFIYKPVATGRNKIIAIIKTSAYATNQQF